MGDCDDSHVLQLDEQFVTFEAVSRRNAVFFDDANKQLFIVKSGGFDGVQVKGPHVENTLNFRLEDKNDVISIKFSVNFEILAVQRSQNVVNFVTFKNGAPVSEFSQSSRGKNSKVIGFVWTSASEIVFICNSGVEYFHISSETQTVKHLKSYSVSINWFIWQPISSVLLLSIGNLGNILQEFHFKASSMVKVNKFEILLANKPSPPKLCLFERDVALVSLYGKTCLLVLKHESLRQSKGAHIAVYTLSKDMPPQVEHVLELQLTGRFAMNIVDDLIAVHHQTSQTSLLFDVRFPGARKEGSICYHSPVIPPYSIKPFKIDEKLSCELCTHFLDSTNWVVFQPNIIIDAKLGYMWLLQINLLPLCRMMSNDSLLFDFLLLRSNSKPVILNICRDIVGKKMFDGSSNVLGKIAFLFKKLNTLYKEAMTTNNSDGICTKSCTVVDQTDMLSSIFCIFEEQTTELNDDFVAAVLFEYINSLVSLQIAVQYFIYELLINVLIRSNRFYQLHQFLQYHVFSDSKPLACLLLSLHPKYPHAIQLSLDMFKRLSVAHEDIVDIFLSQFEVIRALRYVQRHGNVDNISARKFLEFALNSGDSRVFYSIFKFFEERNLRLRGSPSFVRGEHCEMFVEHFQKLFGGENHTESNDCPIPS
ncbi:uncharacterized protein B4U80_07231 [Leptotrombidium deliense]|uniref:Uncharacterized protein n=1 Tax=Leptotrombidium deliense TaxID=299467 RepID=A0A443SM49_9ACAR|nr:uncharacterized protein B4U80_07231 [Leptotrombidium deliense]